MLLLIISNSSLSSLFLGTNSSSSMPSSNVSIASKVANDDDDDGAASTMSQSKLITSSPSRRPRRTRPILGILQYVLIGQVCPLRSILAGNRDEDDVFLRFTISSGKIHEDLTRPISPAGLQILLLAQTFPVSLTSIDSRVSRTVLGNPLTLFNTLLSDKVHPSHLETRSVLSTYGTENRFRASRPIATSSTVLRGDFSTSATSTGAVTDLLRVSEELTARRRFRRSINDERPQVKWSQLMARSRARLRGKNEATSRLEKQQVRPSSTTILAFQRSRALFRATRSLRTTLSIVVLLVASTIPEIGRDSSSHPLDRPLSSIDAIRNRRSRSAAALSAIAPFVALDPTTIAAVAVVLSCSSPLLFTLALSRVVSLRGIIKSLPIARDTISWPVSRRLLIIRAWGMDFVQLFVLQRARLYPLQGSILFNRCVRSSIRSTPVNSGYFHLWSSFLLRSLEARSAASTEKYCSERKREGVGADVSLAGSSEVSDRSLLDAGTWHSKSAPLEREAPYASRMSDKGISSQRTSSSFR